MVMILSVLHKTYNLKQSIVRSDVFHSAAIYKGCKTKQLFYHKAPLQEKKKKGSQQGFFHSSKRVRLTGNYYDCERKTCHLHSTRCERYVDFRS